MADFVHLHLHTVYSLLDGETRINKLVSKAKEFGQKAVAITDHGTMFGVIDFYKEAKKQGIKPILGCELYVAPRTMADKESGIDSERYHLVLLAKNEIGYKNLMKIVSLGYTEGFYYKPRTDHFTLEKYSEGLVALSGCFKGEIPQAILNDEPQKARELAKWYNETFEDFYLEIQNHGLEGQDKILVDLAEIANEQNIELVATNDVHYLEQKDAEMQDILMCIQMGKSVADPDRMKFSCNELYYKSPDEMAELFKDYPKAIENSVKIADMCNVEIEFGKLHLPKFEVEEGKTPFEVLKELCYEGLLQKYKEDNIRPYEDRLEYELGVIEEMGYVDYFLIVHDFIKYAKENEIAVGPGRGSAAGSVVSYCLNITTLEPMQYNLLFERFLNPERVSMPDIDIDFCQARRHEVIEYVIDKYGKNNVAQIATFGTLGARAAIRDVGRVLDVPYAECDRIAKMVPFEIGITLNGALEKTPELKAEYDNNEQIKRLIDCAIALEGVPRHVSTHAAGVVITEKETSEYVPMLVGETGVATQFPMGTLEELGLLKMDFLGLKTLTVIQTALQMTDGRWQRTDYGFDSLDDEETFKLIARGDTDGVFQLESHGMKSFLKELKPNCFEDIVAAVALYRPGPMDSIPKYIESKNGGVITYAHPSLEKILDVTYGCIVYQEQVMQIVQELAGYTLGQADILRRAMGKKKHDVMQAEREKFVLGCEKNDIDKKTADGIFNDMASFASYAFNKSHAAAYAVISYQTAYLKAHYPCEFLAALLCTETDNTSKITKYIAEARNLGIEIAPCNVNVSGENFTPSDGKILFGLVAIKGLGSSIVHSILQERNKNGDFKSFYDFCSRMLEYDINKRAVEGLIKAGAFDTLAKRSQLVAVYEGWLADLQKSKKTHISGQFSMFGESETETEEPTLPNVEEFNFSTLLKLERESTGVFMSGSPLDEYKSVLEKIKLTDIEEFENSTIRDESFVTIAGVLQNVKKKNTKNGALMAFAEVMDQTGTVEVVIFPKTMAECSEAIADGNVAIIKGRAQIKGDIPPSVTANSIQHLTKEALQKVYIKIPNAGVLDELKSKLAFFHGKTPVYIHNAENAQTSLATEDLWVTFCDALAKEIEDLGCEVKKV